MNRTQAVTRMLVAGAVAVAVSFAAPPVAAQGNSSTTSAASPSSGLAGSDSTFVMQTARMNNFEIAAANIAQGSASSPQDKSFAQQMITDHTKAARQLQAAVSQSGTTMTLPTDLDPAGQARLDSLKSARQNFDALYKTQMVSGHQEMYTLFQSYSSKPDANASVKSAIVALMPVVQQHLNSARQLPGAASNSSK
jgi:putative membrane protein